MNLNHLSLNENFQRKLKNFIVSEEISYFLARLVAKNLIKECEQYHGYKYDLLLDCLSQALVKPLLLNLTLINYLTPFHILRKAITN